MLLTVLDTGDLRDASTDALAGFNDRLLELLPSLYEHCCSAGKYAGFVQTLHSGTNLAHVVEHVTLALQCLAGTTVNTGRTHDAGAGTCRVVCAYELEQVAWQAFDAAVQLELASDAALRLALTRCQPGDVMLFATGTSVAELVDALRDFDPDSAQSIAVTEGV